MAASAGSPRGMDLRDFSVDLCLGACWLHALDTRNHTEQVQPLSLAQLVSPRAVLRDGLAYDLTLRLAQPRRRSPKLLHGRIVERERDLYHTAAILPYQG